MGTERQGPPTADAARRRAARATIAALAWTAATLALIVAAVPVWFMGMEWIDSSPEVRSFLFVKSGFWVLFIVALPFAMPLFGAATWTGSRARRALQERARYRMQAVEADLDHDWEA